MTYQDLKDGMISGLNGKLTYSSLLCDKYINEMAQLLARRIDKLQHKIDQCKLSLEENNPNNILSKGYAILENKDGKVISSINDVNEESTYKIHLKDGYVEFTLKDILKEGK